MTTGHLVLMCAFFVAGVIATIASAYFTVKRSMPDKESRKASSTSAKASNNKASNNKRGVGHWLLDGLGLACLFVGVQVWKHNTAGVGWMLLVVAAYAALVMIAVFILTAIIRPEVVKDSVTAHRAPAVAQPVQPSRSAAASLDTNFVDSYYLSSATSTMDSSSTSSSDTSSSSSHHG